MPPPTFFLLTPYCVWRSNFSSSQSHTSTLFVVYLRNRSIQVDKHHTNTILPLPLVDIKDTSSSSGSAWWSDLTFAYLALLNLSKREVKRIMYLTTTHRPKCSLRRQENRLSKLVSGLFFFLDYFPNAYPFSANAAIQSYFCLSPICISYFFCYFSCSTVGRIGPHTRNDSLKYLLCKQHIMPSTIHFHSYHAFF